MPIGIGQPLQITVSGVLKNQVVNIVGWFVTDGAIFLTATPEMVGEAFWNHIKTTWRALHMDNPADKTLSVLVSEQGPTGNYGEYAIPPAEQVGTRTIGGVWGFAPAFVSPGIRLTVASRVTRPGQKRPWGITDEDILDSDALVGAYVTLVQNFAAVWTAPMILGAPLALGVLQPIVARVTSPGNVVTAQQNVTGYVVNPNVTSQVSRKLGRGV